MLESAQDMQGEQPTHVRLPYKEQRQWKIVLKAVIAVPEDEVAKEMGKPVNKADED